MYIFHRLSSSIASSPLQEISSLHVYLEFNSRAKGLVSLPDLKGLHSFFLVAGELAFVGTVYRLEFPHVVVLSHPLHGHGEHLDISGEGDGVDELLVVEGVRLHPVVEAWLGLLEGLSVLSCG
jgi:hypothetical protein